MWYERSITQFEPVVNNDEYNCTKSRKVVKKYGTMCRIYICIQGNYNGLISDFGENVMQKFQNQKRKRGKENE